MGSSELIILQIKAKLYYIDNLLVILIWQFDKFSNLNQVTPLLALQLIYACILVYVSSMLEATGTRQIKVMLKSPHVITCFSSTALMQFLLTSCALIIFK